MDAIFDVNEYLRECYDRGNRLGHSTYIFGRAECADGYSVSIQASSLHYSIPRKNNAVPYDRVEIGYPTWWDEELKRFREYEDGGVCPCVPVEVINDVLKKHGGIVSIR